MKNTSRPGFTSSLFLASLGFFILAALPLMAQTQMPPPTTLYLLKEGNVLVTTTAEKPTVVNAQIAITGVNAGDVLVAIDVRPQNQILYALGVNATANTLQLYRLVPENGLAVPVGASTGFLTGTLNAVDIPENGYDMDFNPAADRLRVVTTSGLNFRLNPNTGGAVDGDLGTGGNILGVNTDGSFNGGATTASATAYTNNQPNNGNITTQYTLSGDQLFIQSPPNNGTLTQAKSLTEKGNPLPVVAVNGFDIAANINASANNAAVASGTGLAILQTSTASRLCRIDLTNGQVTALGNVTALSFAIRTDQEAALGLSGNALVRFSPYKPSQASLIALSNLTANETAVTLDMRPATGQVYVLGINANANNGTLYLLDPQTGQLTAVGVAGSVAFSDTQGNPVDLPVSATGYEMDFNPTVDRIRVVTGDRLNFRINPNNGFPVDGDGVAAGTNPDAATTFNNQPSFIHGTAYTNNLPSPIGATPVTTLYTLSTSTWSLYIQNPANAGIQTQEKRLTRPFGDPFFMFGIAGFDIPPSVNVKTDAAPVTDNGSGFFVGTADGNKLFRVNLTTGVVRELGVFANAVKSIAVMNLPPQAPLQPPVLPTMVVGQLSEASVDVAAGATVTAKGLPPGLTLNAKNGLITGHPSAPGLYQVTFTAKKGTQTVTYISTFTVQALPTTAIGTFVAAFGPLVTPDSAGRMDITVTNKGSYTLKQVFKGKTVSRTGFVSASPGNPVRIVDEYPDGSSLDIELRPTNSVLGTYFSFGDLYTVEGWRRTFDKTFNPASRQAGYYNIILNRTQVSAIIPQGAGFASVLIGEDGNVKVTGKTADGVGITTASFLGPQNDLLVFSLTYAGKGSVSGILFLGLDADGNYLDNGISGTLAMGKPATSGRTYPDLFMTVLDIEGKYSARAATGSIVLGLPSSDNPSTLDFSSGNVEASATATDLVDSVQYLRPALKAVVPTPGTLDNPAKVSLTINAATGAVTGSFTLTDGNLKRTVKYEGLVIRTFGGTTTVNGFFLLPQIPTGNQTISTSPILSGNVRLMP